MTFRFCSTLVLSLCWLGCSSNGADDSGGTGGSAQGGTAQGGAQQGGTAGQVGSGGAATTGGSATGGSVATGGTGGASGGNSTGGNSTGGATGGGGTGGAATGGTGGTPPVDPCVAAETCPVNTWVNVTPEGVTIPDEGLRAIVVDPSRPNDLYMGGGAAGVWKSTDYGNTWTEVNQGFGYIPQGLCFAVLPAEPATLLVADSCACGGIHKSTDGGATFQDVNTDQEDFYSFAVDPRDGTHLISGFHEQNGVSESTDGGDTWHMAGTSGFPTGGISWFPWFIDTGAADTTAKTWLAIAQNAGSVTMTHDGGATWTVPTGLQGMTHPHGNAQIYQREGTIFVGGSGAADGEGVYRSTDWGATFTKVSPSASSAIVWGTAKHVYSMYAWSCFGCTIDPKFMVSDAAGDTWTSPAVPEAMLMGPDHVAVTSDGTHNIFVAAMRSTGIWRYVEE